LDETISWNKPSLQAKQYRNGMIRLVEEAEKRKGRIMRVEVTDLPEARCRAKSKLRNEIACGGVGGGGGGVGVGGGGWGGGGGKRGKRKSFGSNKNTIFKKGKGIIPMGAAVWEDSTISNSALE